MKGRLILFFFFSLSWYLVNARTHAVMMWWRRHCKVSEAFYVKVRIEKRKIFFFITLEETCIYFYPPFSCNNVLTDFSYRCHTIVIISIVQRMFSFKYYDRKNNNHHHNNNNNDNVIFGSIWLTLTDLLAPYSYMALKTDGYVYFSHVICLH